ncbi:mucoidy inhibitor MuiA family protein [Merismopedia glauca]|uniref:Mucoidy inhibitor MuiA family protein n=1 Tax=Merismopedia glauca CCAP 1448/3 TaxID=1296344 RepID=A0A2T1BX61_9CYAN|nr:mucoidy inhibitor MuiA family protein [Merismopedia glauca]PSB00514.1 hypothetical protein C7B64_23095 [Merismopedia glauca CCAP 1448/3]
MSQELVQQKIESQIDSVVVYTDRARVTRSQTVTLTGNESELVIYKLPTTIITDSIRASGTGNVAVKLLGVRTQKVFSTEPVAEKIAQLQQEIQNLGIQKRLVEDALRGLNLQRQFVENLSEKSVDRFAQSLARQQVTVAETKNLLTFVGQEYGSLSEAIVQRQRQLQQIDKELAVKNQQLQQLQHPRSEQSLDIIISIQPAGSGDLQLQVSYMVENASWTPLYDIRVNEPTKNITLSYLAEVKQGTGEGWNNVNLTLSTAKPGLGTLPPKLNPWYVDIERPLPVYPMMRAASAPTGAVADTLLPSPPSPMMMEAKRSASESEIESFEVESVAAQVSQAGGVVTFELDGNNNIPSDRNPHKVTIFHDEYPCNLQHIAIPKLVSFAYLQALVTNPTDGVTLLPGTANIFRGDTFVGTTNLENIAPGQEFKLDLGIDESIKIERDIVERLVDKKLIGQQRRLTYAYRILVTNLASHPAELKLTEQLPVSRNEQIKVRLNRTNPQIQLGEMGVLEWLLKLPPQGKQEVNYQFIVEYPPQLSVSGLDD